MPSDKSAAKGGGSAISDSSLEALKDAKRGKSRKFVMICKGINIVSLVVFKKGSFEKYKKEAKEAGSGQVFYGVVDGQGENLSFKLARSEGFDKSPVKSLTLKAFLQDEGDFKCKPLMEVVDTMPLVLDPDDNPLVGRFLALRDQVIAVSERNPDRASTLASLCQQIGSHLDADENDAAAAKLDQLEGLLKSLAGGTQAPSPVAPSTETPPDSSGADEWRRLLAEYEPRWERALSAGVGDVSKLRAVMAFAKEKADSGDYSKAIAALKRTDDLMVTPSSPAPTTEKQPAPVPATAPADEDELVELKPFSLVNGQAARLAWDKTRKQVQEELHALEKSIRAAVAAHNEAPDADGEYIDQEVDGGVRELYGILDTLDNRLIDVLDEALNAEGKKREALHKQSVLLIREYRAFVEGSSLMQRIDRNPFLPCSVKKRVDAALAALAKTL